MVWVTMENLPQILLDFDKLYSTSLDKWQQKNPLFLAGFALIWIVLD